MALGPVIPNSRHSSGRSTRRLVPERTLHRIGGFRLARRRVRCLRSSESYPVRFRHWETAMGRKSHSAAPALALGLLFTPPVSIASDALFSTVASLVPAAIGHLGFMSPAMGQPGTFTKKQSETLNPYNHAVDSFKSILG